MTANLRLDLRTAQTLSMTPQLQQAIRLLAMNNLELAEHLRQEAASNPLLSLPESREHSVAARPDAPIVGVDALLGKQGSLAASHEGSLGSDFSNTHDSGHATKSWQSDSEDYNPFDHIASPETLRDHIHRQIGEHFRSSSDQALAAALFDSCDDSGYFVGDVMVLAQQLGAEPNHLESVRQKMLRFDPVGITATSLAECLAAQLAEKNRLDPAMQTLLEHLPLLAKRDLPALKKLCGVDGEDMVAMIHEIRALNPRPVAGWNHEPHSLLAPPDILLGVNRDGDQMVTLNPATLPRALVDTAYHARINAQTRNESEKAWLAEKRANATWIVRAMDQRAKTILKISSEIVRRQRGFFMHGVSHLKPMMLKDIAEAVGVHESTVSRVVSDKTMLTERGVFALKFFFTTALPNSKSSEGNSSSSSVRDRIKSLIEGESATGILSDDDLVVALRREGIDIARRTIAKYREQLGFGSSVQRRRNRAFG